MNKESVKSGLLLGVISIAITMLVYVIDTELMVKWWFGLLSLGLSIFLVSYFGIKYRKEEAGGFLSFGKAYVYSFTVIVVSAIVSTLFTFLLYSVIDPDLPQVLADASYEQSLEMMRSFGADPDSMDDDALDKIREQADNQFSSAGRAKGLIWILVGSVIISLITGAIIKKKEPENELI
jgi:hypothetical protein